MTRRTLSDKHFPGMEMKGLKECGGYENRSWMSEYNACGCRVGFREKDWRKTGIGIAFIVDAG